MKCNLHLSVLRRQSFSVERVLCRHIYIGGGGVKSALLVQVLADVLGKPVVRVETSMNIGYIRNPGFFHTYTFESIHSRDSLLLFRAL